MISRKNSNDFFTACYVCFTAVFFKIRPDHSETKKVKKEGKDYCCKSVAWHRSE